LAAHPGAARLLASVGEVEHGLAFDDPSLGGLFGGSLLAQGVSPDWPRADPPAPEPIVAWMHLPEGTTLSGAMLVAPSRPAGEQHCARYLLDSLAPLGVNTTRLDDRPLNVSAFTSDEVLVHPGSGSAAKNWPAARFAETIRMLERPVRLIVGEADLDAALAVETCLGHALPHLSNIPLEQLAARLAGCHAYLGNDSGVSHLAGLCGARSIVLFGPTNPQVWHPLGLRVHVRAFETPGGEIAKLVQGERTS
jgi:hypothetical protein